MRALLISEGKHEAAGVLQFLVSRLVEASFEFEHEKVANLPHVHGKERWIKKARLCLLAARKRACEVVIAVLDEDGDRSRVQQFNRAHDDPANFEIRKAFGVAIRTFDAWMLADECALTAVLGYTVQRQPDPETLHDPKAVCGNLLDDSAVEMSQSEMYSQVAHAANIQVLTELCSKGFAPFAARVRGLR